MPTALPIKFRCYQCNQLLGVSRSKAGAVVACPQCSAELLVPDDREDSEAGTTREFDSATSSWPSPTEVRIEPSVVPWDAPPEPSSAEQPSFPNIQVEPVSLRPDPPARLRTALQPKTEPSVEDTETRVFPSLVSSELESQSFAVGDAADVGPSVARVSPPSLRDAGARRNDVVLPRTIVALWSFLVLLAVVFAFVAGLLAGRFLWASHTSS